MGKTSYKASKHGKGTQSWYQVIKAGNGEAQPRYQVTKASKAVGNRKLLTMVSCHQGKKSREKMNVRRAQSINVCRRELKTKCGGLIAKPFSTWPTRYKSGGTCSKHQRVTWAKNDLDLKVRGLIARPSFACLLWGLIIGEMGMGCLFWGLQHKSKQSQTEPLGGLPENADQKETAGLS